MRLIDVGVLCVSTMLLSGCAVISVLDTAVSVTSTVVSTTVNVAAGAVDAVAGSSSDSKKSDEACPAKKSKSDEPRDNKPADSDSEPKPDATNCSNDSAGK